MFDNMTLAETNTILEFYHDVIEGLGRYPKKISSKYFYNKKGDELFQKIMDLDEYYLTRAELEIFTRQSDKILRLLSEDGAPFNILEFGAGDGSKTKVLLRHFLKKRVNITYLPIDISRNALDGLAECLSDEIPELSVKPLQGDYFETLNRLTHDSDRKNVVLFLGSNIGNFSTEDAISFLTQVKSNLNPGDFILIGFDLKKNPEKIRKAYSDSMGITAEFNLNLLDRINEELCGNFDRNKFYHHATYDPVSGECRSMLISKEDQQVCIDEQVFIFEKWEPIHTEISKKYSLHEIESIRESSGFELVDFLFDSARQYTDAIWQVG